MVPDPRREFVAGHRAEFSPACPQVNHQGSRDALYGALGVFIAEYLPVSFGPLPGWLAVRPCLGSCYDDGLKPPASNDALPRCMGQRKMQNRSPGSWAAACL